MNQVTHATMTLDPAIRTAVPHHVRGVLRHWASTNCHDDISLNRLFLMVADGLVQDALSEKPQSLEVENFEKLADKPSPAYPDYGLDHRVATLIRHTIWEQFVQGILAPDPRRIDTIHAEMNRARDLRYACLTAYGVQVLSDPEDRILVHDPEGYLASLEEAEPPPDTEMMSYLAESLSVFRSSHLRATILLLHMASERLLDCLASSLGDALAGSGTQLDFHSKYNSTREVSKRFKLLEDKLMGVYSAQLHTERLKEGFQDVVKPTFHSIRHARNAIAHLKGHDFTWNNVGSRLFLFAHSFHHTNAIIAFLRAQS